MNSHLPRLSLAILVFLTGVFTAFAQLPPGTAAVSYDPGLTRVEGDQPLTKTVFVAIHSPDNVPVGGSVTVTPVLSMLGQPSGVPDSVALSYVTFNPSTLTFTGPNQTVTARIDLEFPRGVDAGVYSYMFVTSGWAPGTQDLGGFLNATIYPEITPGGPPSVSITTPADNSVFTYFPLVGPLSVPISFTSSAPESTPVTNVDADLNGALLTLASTTGVDGVITSTTTASIAAPGVYTLRARATNADSTATDTSDFTVVVSAPPPTAAIALPLAGATFTLPANGSLAVPYTFTGVSFFGGITSLTATLNGQPVNFTAAGLTTLTATGSGNFNITTGGAYELVVTATDGNGTATAKTTFTVNGYIPPPTISISSPLNGATFSRMAGDAPTQIPFTYAGDAGTGYTITSLTGTLNGSPVTATLSGIGTMTATGSGTLSVSTGGTFVLSATTTSVGGTASASVTFTVNETPPPAAACSVNWLPPISLGRPFKAGSNVSIKFELDCNTCGDRGIDRDGDGDPDHYPGQRTKSKINIDKTVVIAITEILSDGGNGPCWLFPYSSSPNAPGYTIQGNDMYHLNFPAPSGKKRYRVEVFGGGSGSPVLYGTREFTTR
ncbi:MAG: hypothetical protein C0518_01585 [Opitutus sp.]|nr:hypothetical protein [Opitutus sp.]